MKISIIEGNEKIPFWNRVTKPRTESCADNKCNDREKLSSPEGSSCGEAPLTLKLGLLEICQTQGGGTTHVL